MKNKEQRKIERDLKKEEKKRKIENERKNKEKRINWLIKNPPVI